MKFNLKTYQENKTKQYLKDSKFVVLSTNANKKSQNWVITEQELLKLKLGYYKIYNKTTKKIIKDSIYLNFVNIIGSTFFFLKPANNNEIQIDTKNQRLDFITLAIKLNKKVYATPQLKTIQSFHYKKNVSVLYQFLLANLKSSYFLK
jgi:hypothetical protein